MKKRQSCDERLLTLYHYNELQPEERLQLEEHLKWCSQCRNSLSQLSNCLTDIPIPKIDISAADRLNFTDQVLKKTTKPRFAGKPVWGGALVVTGLLMLLLVILPNPTNKIIKQPKPSLSELELIEQLELLQNLDLLQDMELLKELEDLG